MDAMGCRPPPKRKAKVWQYNNIPFDDGDQNQKCGENPPVWTIGYMIVVTYIKFSYHVGWQIQPQVSHGTCGSPTLQLPVSLCGFQLVPQQPQGCYQEQQTCEDHDGSSWMVIPCREAIVHMDKNWKIINSKILAVVGDTQEGTHFRDEVWLGEESANIFCKNH